MEGGEGRVHCAQDVRRLERARRARGARRGADARVAEVVEHRLALDVGERDVERVREAQLAAAVHDGLRDGEEALLQAVAQRGDAIERAVAQLGGGELARLAEAGDVGDVLRAGAAAPLLVAAEQERPHGRAAADVERADALRGVDLVAGEGQHVERRLGGVDARDLADGLRGVGVEDGARGLRELRALADGEEDARLVVRPHQRHELRAGDRERGAVGVQVERAVAVHADAHDAVAALLDGAARLEDGGVLDLARDHGRLRAERLDRAEDRLVVALATAAREDDLRGVRRAEQRRDLRARGLHVAVDATAELVHARRVPPLLGEERHHRLDDLRRGHRRRVVVQVVQLGHLGPPVRR